LANTFTQCYVHLVFSPQHRDALINKAWKDELEKYIMGIIQNRKHKLLAIGLMPDHIHILIGYNVNDLLPDLVAEIKISTNTWIKDERLSKFKFDWQRGYGAFTHSRTQIDTVIQYILNQEHHHQKTTFKIEYLDMLTKNGVEYKDEYLFDFFESMS
jgi:putative transposase